MTEPLNIHQRLLAAMKSVDYIQKEKKQGMNYTIVSHDKVTAKVRPVLCDNGITYRPVKVSYNQNGNRTECHMVVRFTNADNPEDWIDCESFGFGVDSQDKGPGKAMSYAVKYALLKTLGLETGDDPDYEQGPTSNHVSQAVHDLKAFVEEIDMQATVEALQALLARNTATIAAAGQTHPADVATAKQKYAAKLRELKTPAPADA